MYGAAPYINSKTNTAFATLVTQEGQNGKVTDGQSDKVRFVATKKSDSCDPLILEHRLMSGRVQVFDVGFPFTSLASLPFGKDG